MRLFVALEIAAQIRNHLADFVARIKPQIGEARWSRPDALHITLKFLGHVPDEKRHAIEERLGRVEAGAFSLSLREVGVFPNLKSPRVIWVGVQAPRDLARLAEQIEFSLEPLGFAREERPYSPHVTLARFKVRPNKAGVSVAISSAPKDGFGTMTAKEFHLYESKPSPQGSQYIKLSSSTLK